MLSLRLTRGAHPLVLLRRVLVAAAAAGAAFLLLCALGYAVAHPKRPEEGVVRLLWCAVPCAAVVHFALAVARTDPATRPRDGLDAIGLGPVRLALLAAASTAVTCALGSGAALLAYLELRGDLGGTPLSGTANRLLDGGHALPWAATVTLLALLPAVSAGVCALVLRPREEQRKRRPGPAHARPQPDGAPAPRRGASPGPRTPGSRGASPSSPPAWRWWRTWATRPYPNRAGCSLSPARTAVPPPASSAAGCSPFSAWSWPARG
ncbi:hypothetical protein ACQEVS_24600 [Streptomyces sp. CA-181903]|uniref:hypothetical protein n=1 Tax=Streptomyces sp. CA-181903 TaxID=3240055 RepID=UPI003D8EDCE8